MRNILLGATALTILVLLVVAVANRDAVFGSVIQSQEYQYRYVDITDASSTVPIVLSSGNGVLGSIVVASSTYNGTLTVYNATSTEATSTAEVITVFSLSNTPNTYTFVVSAPKGVKVWVDSAFDGKYTITYRQ